MAKQHERTLARQAALQVLYSGEIVSTQPSKLVEEDLVLEDDFVLTDYAKSLIAGVDEHRDEIDDLLEESSENWSLSRMPIVDRSILRLAVYEMKYVDVVPLSVSINEAVEMAKAFGGEDESSRFVNGVLGKVARVIQPNADLSDVAEESAE